MQRRSLLLAAGAAWANAGAARPPLRVGPSRNLRRIADAAREAQDGDIIEIDAGDYVADVALWDRAEITLRGVGGRVRLLAGGAHTEGKAIWVVRRGRVTVEHIDFIGARVPDRNGAGIRFESGELMVRHCRFIDNENGILTGGNAASTLVVEFSEFGHNGAGDGLSHGLYVGAIASFRLTGCHVHHGRVGHLVKSRARFNRVEYSRLADEAGGRASYELEFPNGGRAEVVGNVIQQVENTENAVMVSFGAEGYERPGNELAFVHNTVVNERAGGGRFLRVRPGADVVLLRNNVFAGSGSVDASGVADAAGDLRVALADLQRPSDGDYRLSATAVRRIAGPPLPVPAALMPKREYLEPTATRLLDGLPAWPGALQPR